MNFNQDNSNNHPREHPPAPPPLDEMSSATGTSEASAHPQGSSAACPSSSSANDGASSAAPPPPPPIKRVCFICGSHTTQTINIYERRAGPNLVEVINAKFKVPPLTEDKFLCYSCNNWLINWYSVQNQRSSSTPTSPSSSPSSSSSAAAGCSKPSQNTKKRNHLRASSSIRGTVDRTEEKEEVEAKTAPIEKAMPEANDDVYYFRGCLETLELRNKLAMHIHRHKQVDEPPSATVAAVASNTTNTTTTSSIPSDAVTITKIDRDANHHAAKEPPPRLVQHASTVTQSITRLPRQLQSIKCNMCGKPLQLRSRPPCPWGRRPATVPNPRCVRFCRQCRRATHKLYFANTDRKANEPSANQQHPQNSFVTIVCDPLAALATPPAAAVIEPQQQQQQPQPSTLFVDQQQQRVVNPSVVSRLKRLGTTVMREGEVDDSNSEMVMTMMSDDRSTCTTTESSSSSSSSYLQQSSPLLFSSLISKRPRHGNPHHHRPSSSWPTTSFDETQSGRPSSQTLERNDKNEIVLAFDRTLTEVFPSASGSMVMSPDPNHSDGNAAAQPSQGCGFSQSAIASSTTSTTDGIYSRIPKSLSITMLS